MNASRGLKSKRLIIAGGGLIGLFAAHYAQSRGAQVTVVERDKLGSGASRGNGGLIIATDSVPLPAPGVVSHGLKHLFSQSSAFFVSPTALIEMSPFLLRFARMSTSNRFWASLRKLDVLNSRTMKLYDELSDAGIGRSVSNTGILRCFRSKKAAVSDLAMYASLAARAQFASSGELLDRDDLLEMEPSLGAAPKWGFLQTGRWVSPSTLIDDLVESLTSRGVEFQLGSSVHGFTENATEVQVHADSGTLDCDILLIASGAWSNQVVGNSVNLFVKPGKGYSLTVKPDIPLQRPILFGDAHIGATPMADGTVRIAGTMEFDGTFDRLRQSRITSIKRAAENYLTGTDWTGSKDEWAGPRPMTPDGLPHIGLLPGSERTYVAAGHNMLGLSLGPATGELISALMCGEFRPAAIAAFSPGRFAGRKQKKSPQDNY